MRITNKTLFFSGIILFMTHTSTEKTQFLNQCFFMAFIESKKYKADLDGFIDSDGSSYSFRLKDFINHQKAKNETLGLIPIDVLFEGECPSEIIDKIENDFSQQKTISGGYTKLFLEYLFDEKFKTEFNKLAKEKITDKENEIASKNYFSTKNMPGMFPSDLVEKYFEAIKASWDGIGAEYDFSGITERVAVRSVKSKNIVSGTEKFDNVYSPYKIYAQGIYSKILISLLERAKSKKIVKEPNVLCGECISAIVADKTIQKGIPKSVLSKTINENDVLDTRVFELEVEKINYELQRFFDDYVPSDLNRIYIIEGTKAHNGETLRELLLRDFKGIFSEEKRLYEKVNRDKNLYEKITYRKKFFSYYELEVINKYFEHIVAESSDYTLLDKIKLITDNMPELLKNTKWQEILEKVKEYWPDSLDCFNKEIKDERISSPDKEYDKKENDSVKNKLIKLFKKYFNGEKQFLSNLEYDIQSFENFDAITFIKTLKGKQEHPWARFWTIYIKNSEIQLYPVQKLFTKLMNKIESEINKISSIKEC